MLRYYSGKLRHVVSLLTATTLLAATITDVVAAQSPRARKVISIAEARALPPGTVVTIKGVVTVPSGAFKASSSNEGFAVQDNSGGIYVSLHVELGLRVGRGVRVTGKLTELNGFLVIEPPTAKAIAAQGRGHIVQPALVATSKINEQTLGRLVQVTGTITQPVGGDPPYGFRFFVNDGTGEVMIYVSASTKITRQGWRPGQRVRVTGLSGKYKDHYELEPRFPADISPSPQSR